jgi:hypothetical protein
MNSPTGAIGANPGTMGAAAILVERANRISDELGSTLDGRRLLDLLTRINDRDTISYESIEDIAPLLETDEERAAMSKLISAALVETDDHETTSALTMLSFLIERRSPSDPEVVAFVRNGLNVALAGRGSGSQSRTKHFNHHDARSTLIEAKEVFDAHAKRFFLDRGTLLGAIRENGFIANDYDIDVGIFADEVSLDDVKTMFEPTDFIVNQDFEYKVGLLSSTGIQVDFFLTTRERGYYLSKGFRSVHSWYFSPFELMEYPFLGSTFYVPDTYEKHLDENYGNWRNPAIFYDLSYNEPCVAYGQAAYPLGYLTRRMSGALRSGERYLSEAPATRLRDQFAVDYTDWFPRASVEPVKPDTPSQRTVHPIVIVDDLTQYSHRVRRLVQSALSITADVHLMVDAGHGHVDEQTLVAEAIDRISHVGSVTNVSEESLGALLACRPRAIVIPPESASAITASFSQRARLEGCEVVVFGDDSVALTVDSHDLVTVRQR